MGSGLSFHTPVVVAVIILCCNYLSVYWAESFAGNVVYHSVFHSQQQALNRQHMSSVWAQSLSRVWLLAIPWTTAYRAPLSTEFARQKYQSGLPFPPPRNLPALGMESASSALAGRFFTTSATWETPKEPNKYLMNQCTDGWMLSSLLPLLEPPLVSFGVREKQGRLSLCEPNWSFFHLEPWISSFTHFCSF